MTTPTRTPTFARLAAHLALPDGATDDDVFAVATGRTDAGARSTRADLTALLAAAAPTVRPVRGTVDDLRAQVAGVVAALPGRIAREREAARAAAVAARYGLDAHVEAVAETDGYRALRAAAWDLANGIGDLLHAAADAERMARRLAALRALALDVLRAGGGPDAPTGTDLAHAVLEAALCSQTDLLPPRTAPGRERERVAASRQLADAARVLGGAA